MKKYNKTIKTILLCCSVWLSACGEEENEGDAGTQDDAPEEEEVIEQSCADIDNEESCLAAVGCEGFYSEGVCSTTDCPQVFVSCQEAVEQSCADIENEETCLGTEDCEAEYSEGVCSTTDCPDVFSGCRDAEMGQGPTECADDDGCEDGQICVGEDPDACISSCPDCDDCQPQPGICETLSDKPCSELSDADEHCVAREDCEAVYAEPPCAGEEFNCEPHFVGCDQLPG